MNIVFRFCDKGWTPTKNVFLLNSQYSTYYFLDFEELPLTVINDARYHHKSSFPDDRDQVEFPFNGKWRFYVTDTQDWSIVYGTGKFFVVHNDVELAVRVKRDELEDQSYWPVELAKAINVTTDFYLPDDFHPAFVDRIDIIDNQRIYDPVIIDRKTNTLFRFYKWDANRSFTFTARDIPAGNDFRQVDIRDHNLFSTKDVRAQLDAFGWVGDEWGKWSVLFPEDVLREWFEGNAASKGRFNGTSLYGILGIQQTTTPDQVKTAYRRMAKIWHPDVNREPDAEERFKRVNEAYQIISDQRNAHAMMLVLNLRRLSPTAKGRNSILLGHIGLSWDIVVRCYVDM